LFFAEKGHVFQQRHGVTNIRCDERYPIRVLLFTSLHSKKRNLKLDITLLIAHRIQCTRKNVYKELRRIIGNGAEQRIRILTYQKVCIIHMYYIHTVKNYVLFLKAVYFF